jgi:hypothetical protein
MGEFILGSDTEGVVNSISKQIFLLYGRPKIGKSKLAAQFPSPIFAATEPGCKYLGVTKNNILTWVDFLYFCKALIEQKHEHKNIVIDTVDVLVRLAADFVCEKAGINHPGDLPHGKGWGLVTDEIRKVLNKLTMQGLGVIMITHSKDYEIETRKEKYTKIDLSLSGGNKAVVENLADHILLIDSGMDGDTEVRFIRTQGSKYWNAGSRNDKLQEAGAIKLSYEELSKYFTE